MFGLFKKKNTLPSQTDRIWKSEREKDIGLVNDINKFTSAGQTVVLFYYFEQSKIEVKQLLSERKVDFSEDITAPSQVFLISAEDIDKSSAFANTMSDKFSKDVVKLLFAEHYPTKTLENVLALTLKDMSEEDISLIYYLSLECKLMRIFGAERIIKIMESPIMGMKDGECIEHSMITKSIFRAQVKIEGNVQNEIKCDSQEDWFAANGINPV
jgi:preprotein translocase subunit SecA